METIRKQLELMKRGHVTTMWGIIVLRRNGLFVVGKTINIRSAGVGINEAAKEVFELSRD